MVDVMDEISIKNELIRLLSADNDRLRKSKPLYTQNEELIEELDKAKKRNFGNYNQELMSEAEDYFHHNEKAERVIFLMVADSDIGAYNQLIGDIDQFKISDIANKTITQGE